MTKSYEFHLTVEVPDDYNPPAGETIKDILDRRFGNVHPDVAFEVEER